MTFTDGQRAIDTLKNRLTNLPIDLIITDWNMLEATGLQILEYV
jgi:CheY-like chemotaxis protein